MPQDFGEYDYIDAGEDNYEKLFNSDWCPLLGRMPDIGMVSQNSDESRSVEIIYNARELWGIKSTRRYTLTDQLIESINDETEEILSYPRWRLDAAQAIAHIHPKVKNEADIVSYDQDGRPIYSQTQLDQNWKRAIEIVKESIPGLNEQIKNNHIFAVLAIAEARDVLKSLLSDKEKKDTSDIKD